MSAPIREGQGHGYRDDQGRVCMLRCFMCGRENYAMAVSTGGCAWCGYQANAREAEDA